MTHAVMLRCLPKHGGHIITWSVGTLRECMLYMLERMEAGYPEELRVMPYNDYRWYWK